jgi:hypothetical protein
VTKEGSNGAECSASDGPAVLTMSLQYAANDENGAGRLVIHIKVRPNTRISKILVEGKQLWVCTGLRTARVKIISGIPNLLNYCVIIIVFIYLFIYICIYTHT